MHGFEWKYDLIFEIAKRSKAEVAINAGDMLPKHGDLFQQGVFITSFLDRHFERFEDAGIYYLCYPGNDDLLIFDRLFDEVCSTYRFIVNLAQRKYDINGYEFIGMNWVVDYPFRLKDRCRMDKDNFVFEKQLGTALLSTQEGFREVKDWPSYVKSLPTVEEEMKRLVHPGDMGKAVYVIHSPPAKLGLDRCFSGLEVGSMSIYDFIRKDRPLLALHGHIHESPQMTAKWFAK